MLLAIALLVLGLMGSLWSTVYALLEYRAQRLEEFDALAREVLFTELYPDYGGRLFVAKLRQWDFATRCATVRDAFRSLHQLSQLSALEYETFVSLAVESLCRRRLWLPRKYITQRVRDLAPQYVWHTPVLQLLHVCLTTDASSPPSSSSCGGGARRSSM